MNLLAPAGGPIALAVPTAVLGAQSPVTEAFAAGFLSPVIPSLVCGPFGTVLVRMLEPVFRVSVEKTGNAKVRLDFDPGPQAD